MSGYLNAIQPRTASIILAGKLIIVERACLGLHLQLARVAGKADVALQKAGADLSGSEVNLAARHVCAYLALAGVEEHCASATGVELFLSYLVLSTFNAPMFLLPFMKSKPKKDPPAPAYDYPDRGFAIWIHRLATRYGWTRHYILDQLYPEEAMAYLQEIAVSEYFEHESVRVLQRMAYVYDKAGKKLRYRALPMPPWMAGYKGKLKTVRIHRRMLPMGDVINLNTLTADSVRLRGAQ